MSAPGVYHALLLTYGRAAVDLAYVRPMSADVNYGSTADLSPPTAGVHDHLTTGGDFYVGRTGNTARRFNVLDLTGAIKDTYTKGAWGFICMGSYGHQGRYWDGNRSGFYANYGGELGLMIPDGAGTFLTYFPSENIVGVNGGLTAGQEGQLLMGVGDQTSSARLRYMTISGGVITSSTLEATGGTYGLFSGAWRQNPERCYFTDDASRTSIKYYSRISDGIVTVITGLSPGLACRGVMGLRQYDDVIPARVGFDSTIWCAHNGTPATVVSRDPHNGSILHTVTLPSGYNTVVSNSSLYIGPDGTVWVHATNGGTTKVFGCRGSSAAPVKESPALLNSRFPMGITANNYMAFHHTVGIQLYYSLMRC